MLYKIGYLFLLFILAMFLCDAPAAHACSCGGGSTILDAYERATNILIAQALSVEKAEKGFHYNGIRSTKMVVVKVFKGRLKAGDAMIFTQSGNGGGDCTWAFSEQSVGKQFLFYLYEEKGDQGYWTASICSRSSHLEGATDDLSYLENLDKVRGKTRLSGQLRFSQDSPFEDDGGLHRLLEGRKIRIIGEKKTYEAITNQDGVYVIYDLPAGTYTLEPEVPDNWKIDYQYASIHAKTSIKPGRSADKDLDEPEKQLFQVVLESGKHAYSDFSYGVKNFIRGKVFDPAGKALKSVCVYLVPAQGNPTKYFSKFACTDKEGVYMIDNIPPGSYLVVANQEGKISSDEPFPTLYYPNVFERENAGVVIIGAGEVREEVNITAPKMAEMITVEGVCLYADGKPATDEWVEFKAGHSVAGIEGNARAQVDANGRFSIKILKGLKGTVYNEIYVYAGKFESCPKLDELIRKSGRDSADIKTNTVEIQAETSMTNVKLTFPFPFCRKAKSSY
jgi:hypothetical protein